MSNLSCFCQWGKVVGNDFVFARFDRQGIICFAKNLFIFILKIPEQKRGITVVLDIRIEEWFKNTI
jgi:hypothetical protein